MTLYSVGDVESLVYLCIFPLIHSRYFDYTLFSQKNYHKPFGMVIFLMGAKDFAL